MFWDVEIPPGTTWADFLAEKLAVSKAAIVLWSATSTASQWVREEARLARDKGKLIPVMIDASAPPFGFGEIQAANLAGWNGEADHPQWKLLLAVIARAVGAAATGQAKAAPIRQAASGGWDSARAGGAPASGNETPKKKPNLPLLIGGGVVALLVVLGVVGALSGGDDGAEPRFQTEISAEAQQAVSVAQEALQAANAAVADAATQATAGQQAANAAQTGMGGYGMSQGPMGAIAGDLSGAQAGRAAAVGIAMAQGAQFYGTMQVMDPSGASYALNGNVVVPGGATASGVWQYGAGGYSFVGGGANPNKWSILAREQGRTDGSGTNGVGQIRYANGDVYLGHYRAVGEGAQAQVFRHGAGVYYDAKGAVLNAGTFHNDAFAG